MNVAFRWKRILDELYVLDFCYQETISQFFFEEKFFHVRKIKSNKMKNLSILGNINLVSGNVWSDHFSKFSFPEKYMTSVLHLLDKNQTCPQSLPKTNNKMASKFSTNLWNKKNNLSKSEVTTIFLTGWILDLLPYLPPPPQDGLGK